MAGSGESFAKLLTAYQVRAAHCWVSKGARQQHCLSCRCTTLSSALLQALSPLCKQPPSVLSPLMQVLCDPQQRQLHDLSLNPAASRMARDLGDSDSRFDPCTEPSPPRTCSCLPQPQQGHPSSADGAASSCEPSAEMHCCSEEVVAAEAWTGTWLGKVVDPQAGPLPVPRNQVRLVQYSELHKPTTFLFFPCPRDTLLACHGPVDGRHSCNRTLDTACPLLGRPCTCGVIARVPSMGHHDALACSQAAQVPPLHRFPAQPQGLVCLCRQRPMPGPLW